MGRGQDHSPRLQAGLIGSATVVNSKGRGITPAPFVMSAVFRS